MERPNASSSKYDFPNGDFNKELYDEDCQKYIDYLEEKIKKKRKEIIDRVFSCFEKEWGGTPCKNQCKFCKQIRKQTDKHECIKTCSNRTNKHGRDS